MPLLPIEFRDNLLNIANDLQEDDYRRVLKRNLKPALDQVEKDQIIIACERIISFLKGKEKEEFIKGYSDRQMTKRMFKRLSKDGCLNRKDSIIYTGLPESTFDKKIDEMKKEKGKEHFKDEYGTSRINIDDLDKIARLIVDSNKSVLCIERLYLFDDIRQGYIPFEKGEYYEIIEENDRHKELFNADWKVCIPIGNATLIRYFRIKDEL